MQTQEAYTSIDGPLMPVSSRLPPPKVATDCLSEHSANFSDKSEATVMALTPGQRGRTTDDIEVDPLGSRVPVPISDARDDQVESDRELAEAIAATESSFSVGATTQRATPVGDAFVTSNGGDTFRGLRDEPLPVQVSRMHTLAEALRATANTADELRSLLASPGVVDLAAAGRPRAVRKCVAFVNDLLQTAGDDELPANPTGERDAALCGWPVRSYNECAPAT